MMEKRTLVAFLCTIIILGVGVAVGVYFGLTIGKGSKDNDIRVQPILDSRSAALSFFSQTDGLDIRWSSGLNTSAKLSQALSGGYMMLSSSVSLVEEDFVNGSSIPMMGATGQNSIGLDSWLKQAKNREKIGVKLTFHSISAVEPALLVLQSSDLGSRPVWLEANILSSSGPEPVVDSNKFFELIQKHYPRAVLSMGWTTTCCEGVYTQKMVEEMYKAVEQVNHHITFMIRSSWLKGSHSAIRWLLMKSNRFSVTIWSPPESVGWEGISLYDLVDLRNDFYIDRVYYQLQGKMRESFSRLAITAGNPMNVFKRTNRDALDITFAHAVNSRDKFKVALQGREDFLEADIVLNTEGDPIMSHPPNSNSDLSFEFFINGSLLTLKGVKLDFKSTDAVNPSLFYLQTKYSMLHQPVWLNADVLKGPGGEDSTPLDGQQFLRYVRNRFPQCTISLGWTTKDQGAYTAQHIDEMLALVSGVKQPLTFPIRASLARKSWTQLTRLLAASRSYSLTLWSNDPVNVDDLVFIRENSETDRVYYDLLSRTMNEFRLRI